MTAQYSQERKDKMLASLAEANEGGWQPFVREAGGFFIRFDKIIIKTHPEAGGAFWAHYWWQDKEVMAEPPIQTQRARRRTFIERILGRRKDPFPELEITVRVHEGRIPVRLV